MKLGALAWIERLCMPFLALAAIAACLSFYGLIAPAAYRPAYVSILVLAIIVGIAAHWRGDRHLGAKPRQVEGMAIGLLVLGFSKLPIWANGVFLVLFTGFAFWAAFQWWRPGLFKHP